MRTLLTLILLSVVALTSCDEGRQMAGDIINEPVATEPVMPDLGTQVAVTYSVYDVNEDGAVDSTDLSLVSAALGQANPDNPRLDVDGNGSVDGGDIILVSNHLGDTSVPTEEPTPAVESEYPEITYENAFDLEPGVYRMRPNSYSSRSAGIGDDIISVLLWGSVGDFGVPIAGAPPDAPKILLVVGLDPKPYEKMLDGRLVIEAGDEILVEIADKFLVLEETGGERGNRFTYEAVYYDGKVIANLTNPDRIFESD